MKSCGFNVPLDQLCPEDRREMRNFERFLRLWPTHGFDMLDRPRWQKYLGVTPIEAEALKKNPPFTAASIS